MVEYKKGYVKGYRFLSFAKNMGKKIGKNIRKNLSGKYSPGMLAMHQKLLDHTAQSVTDTFKTASKRAIQKTAEATGVWLVIKLLIELQRFQKIHSKIIQTVTNEHDKEIPKKRYVSPEERQGIIDELRLK